ncbi:MAG: ethylbenzene dehydrogenase-related protein [Rhodocyclaceae bacterium]|nr:ethylbenzene dehydrogenase-related protein [Rhodocyclaceae bacterium]MDP1957825.1 ethylbenzene dehydrogenase-related protein [Rhodocyclaceae bacterium]
MRRLALVLLALLPALAMAQAEIRIGRTAVAVGADPDHPAWDAAPASVIKLETAFPGHPSIVGTAVTQGAEIRALATPAGLAIRLEWDDPVADTQKTPDRFADGIAIQFPRDGKTDTMPYMGGAGRHVNIWYWSAARNASGDAAENLWADGFGTLTRMPTQDVKARGRHADGKWRVVFFRALRSSGPGAVKLRAAPGGSQPLAFAVWDGANDERDGFKAVTMQWQSLRWEK